MDKIWTLLIIWLFVVVAYIFIGVSLPAISDISDTTSTAMQASGNMTEQPGIQGAVESSPVWIWIIPGFVGIVSTVWLLKWQKR